MATNKFDELNIVAEEVVSTKETTSISIENYFEEMELEEGERDRRIGLAIMIYGLLVYLLTFIRNKKDELDKSYCSKYLSDNLAEIYAEVFGDDRYQNRAYEFSRQFLNVTYEHLDSNFFTSSQRALINAENEANFVCNQNLYEDAVASGRHKKTWITKRDKRVRHTHVEVDNLTIGILDVFEVGNSELLFPGDASRGADGRELVNCRCVCRYR